ncbi:arylamine N-acetyltransferase [Fulvivirga sp. M361]|uniref:arylamine N-acetyltransferase family protein n=1 Tax=Fulvivirga sp. M361 TaxID=2594266 RepID=UPI00117B40FD|nr:arylamine N-acetyltransferase [Fulvivirga sp. M361]TRX57685.1 arylamine N-acetyltransferase [Fulvivirga sp. M361]
MYSDYLNRIGFKKKIQVNEETLQELHRQHVLNIPFEDLDIHYGIPIQLEPEAIYDKVIRKMRGGFCYELNYLFWQLLNELGFKASMISSRIYDQDQILGPEFDHMSIVVDLKDKWLVDVGFGDLFISPIKMEENVISRDWFKSYKINKLNEHDYTLSESIDESVFTRRYQFNIQPRSIADFQPQCKFKQYSSESHFVKNMICTLPNDKGRITIINNRFIEKREGVKKESIIDGEEELFGILHERFKININSKLS